MSTTNSEEIEKEQPIIEEQETENKEAVTDDAEKLSDEEQLQSDLGKEKDKYLRLFAEFENYKRRTSKERVELFTTANQEVLQSLLPVMDDFDRGLIEIRKSGAEDLVKGVELIHDKLKGILNSKGLEVIEVNAGDAFDADIHEAITQIPAPSEDMKGKIIDQVEKGYKLGSKTIRFPKVVIGS